MQMLVWIAGTYIAICVAGYFGNRLFMYFPDPSRYTPAEAGLEGVEELEIAAADGTTLVAWRAPAQEGKPTILYFHGNAGNAAGRAEKLERIRADGYGFLYLNARGYGGSAGRPSEKDNVADAVTAYETLTADGVAPEEIVLYGESLGSGQAVRLGGMRPVKAVILEAALTSTVDIARQTYFWLPLKLILTDQYRNVDNIRAVSAPLLILHGERDEIIPVDHARQIFEAANEPKRLELMPAGMHNDLYDHGAWERAHAFLQGL